MTSLAQRFFTRFSGLPRAHGHFLPSGPERERDGKVEGSSETIHAGVTPDLWQGHLDGVYGIGITPVDDSGMSHWGAIDVDIDKRPDLRKIAEDVARMELPLMVCRSKSGGAHLYLFTSEPIPAATVRGKLMEWSVSLGYSGVEVFPKQIRLAGPRDYGNWINLPYFAGDKTVRYCLLANGNRLGPADFLNMADVLAVSASELEDIGMPSDMTFGERLADAPPCLQCISGQGGAGSGNRNKMMFNIGVYLRKVHADQWETYFDAYNCAPFVEEPLGHKELSNLVKSINRKNYQYTCNESPIAQACNRQICLTRKFGIGGADDDPGVVFGSLVKLNTDPPAWIWDVDGARLELTTEELKDQGRFHTTCINVLNKWPKWMKPGPWSALVRQKLEHVEIVEVPPDARPEGQMWAFLQAYCTRAPARSRDELLLDKPWTATDADAEAFGVQVKAGRTYFRAGHFRAFLEQQRMAGVTERKLWMWLRARGTEHHQFNLKGKGINCWSIAAFPSQTEPFTVPRLDLEM